MNSRELLDYHRFCLRLDYVDGIGDYIELYDLDTGELDAFYYPDGYDCLDAYVNHSTLISGTLDIRYSSIVRTTINFTYMNKEKGFSIIRDYIYSLVDEYIDGDVYKLDRSIIDRLIVDTMDGKTEINTRKVKYLWKRRLSKREKWSIMGRNSSNQRRAENMRLVEGAVEYLLDTDVFISAREISYYIDLMYGEKKSIDVVLKTINSDLWEEINNHNEKCYKTKNFNTYMRWCNIHSISGAIRAIQYLNKKVTKGRVAEYASVHRNTVMNLWGEDEVQKALNDYNDYVRSLNKEKIAI